MATIHGLCLKKIKHFEGHDGGALYEADIHLGKDRYAKKIATIRQDYWSGPDQIVMVNGFSQQKLETLIQQYDSERTDGIANFFSLFHHKLIDISILVDDLMLYTEEEKGLNQAIKNGYGAVLFWYCGSRRMRMNIPKHMVEGRSDYNLLTELQPELDKELRKYCKDLKLQYPPEGKHHKPALHLYRAGDSFESGHPLTLDELRD